MFANYFYSFTVNNKTLKGILEQAQLTLNISTVCIHLLLMCNIGYAWTGISAVFVRQRAHVNSTWEYITKNVLLILQCLKKKPSCLRPLFFLAQQMKIFRKDSVCPQCKERIPWMFIVENMYSIHKSNSCNSISCRCWTVYCCMSKSLFLYLCRSLKWIFRTLCWCWDSVKSSINFSSSSIWRTEKRFDRSLAISVQTSHITTTWSGGWMFRYEL